MPGRRATDCRSAYERSRFPSRGLAVRVRVGPRNSWTEAERGGAEPARPEPGHGGVRSLTLRRRRSRVPWIYLVYHRRRVKPLSAGVSAGGESAFRAAEERRNVKRCARVLVANGRAAE